MVDPGLPKIVGLDPFTNGVENDAVGGGGVCVLLTSSAADKTILCMADPWSGQVRHGAVVWDA